MAVFDSAEPTELRDPLGETLHGLRLTRCKYRQSELYSPWGLDVPNIPGWLVFHIVTAGECWIERLGRLTKLQAGSMVLFPSSDQHFLLSEPGASSIQFETAPVDELSPHYQRLIMRGTGNRTRITSGMAALEHTAIERLLEQMPSMVFSDTLEISDGGWLYSSLRLIERESRSTLPAGETILSQLTNIFVLKSIRHWLATAPEAQRGWLGALRDHYVGLAMMLIHAAPGESWTNERLGSAVGLSRHAFGARFMELNGVSVKQYLLDWRMQCALKELKKSATSRTELARNLGYRSEAAFVRAFKRYFGKSPVTCREKHPAVGLPKPGSCRDLDKA